MGTVTEGPPPPPAACIAVGDEVGLLKVVHVPGGQNPMWDQAQIVQTWGSVDRSRGVSCMCMSEPSSTGRPFLAVGRKSGDVELLHPHTGATQYVIPPAKKPQGPDKHVESVVGLTFLSDGDGEALCSKPQLISCSRGGLLRMLEGCSDSSTDAAATTSAPSWKQTASWQAAQKLECMSIEEGSKRVAAGGEGSQVQLWDLSTQERVFQAKGGKPDRVGLVDPAWVTSVAFIPGNEGVLVLAGTVNHKLYLYDTRLGRRPQMDMAWGEARINVLEPEPDGLMCWVGNASGHVACVDFRGRKMHGALKGSTGAVRSLALHSEPLPLIVSVGLDRYLRLYSRENRRQLCKVYAKQQLTAVAFLPPLEAEGASAPAAEAEAIACDGERNAEEDSKVGSRRAATNDQNRCRKRSKKGTTA